MDYPLVFARQFAQLLWLLLHEPRSTEEQKTALRAMVPVTKQGSVTLGLQVDAVQANGQPVPPAFTGMGDLVAQMTMHGLGILTFDAGASPADILGIARILAGMPTLDDGGAAAEAQRLSLGVKTVRFAARPRLSTFIAPVVRTSDENASLPDMELGEVLDDPFGLAMANATPRSVKSVPAPGQSSGDSGLFGQFSAARTPTASPELLLSQLAATADAGIILNLLEDLVILAESAAREGRPAVVCQIMAAMGKRELEVQEFEAKRGFVMALRKLARPDVLRAVATQLPRDPAKHDEYVAILTRAGDDGADALIDQISAVAHQRDRRIYFDVLLQLKAGVSSLLHMLTDHRWFVARNAAELLGEMQIKEAEEPLTTLLQHEDDRVRRTATNALMRLGTARAMQAIERALTDSAPQMRIEAAGAYATRRDLRNAATLLRAVETERDPEVLAAFLLSLGKLGTPDAVRRLISAAEPEKTLFKKKTASFRVAAVHALAEARTNEASEALRALQADKDAEVRDAVTFALARIARSSGNVSTP